MTEIFLSGNQRSGKTLVQLILASHPEITISPGTNVIAKTLYGFPRGALLDAAAIRTVRQVLQKDRKFKAWRVDHQAYQAMVARYGTPEDGAVTSRRVVSDLMGFFRDQTKPKASLVGNKKGCYCKEADLVKKVFPEAKFIFIIRDGRGAVSSMLETQPEHDVISASLMWTLKARRIRELAAELPRDTFVVRYEELVTDPERTSRALCDFLGVPYDPAMLENYRHNDAIRHRTDTTHHETYQAISTHMIDEWKTHLSAEQLEIVEGIAGHELEESGYAPSLARSQLGLRSRAKYRLLRDKDHAEWWVAHERKRHTIG